MSGADAARVTALFSRSSGGYRFARWERPLAPALFGFSEIEKPRYAAALADAARACGLEIVETDPELGRNCLVFMCGAWGELPRIPGLDRLVPDLEKLVSVLKATGANQYRIFGFDGNGAIRLCITLLRGDAELRAAPFPLLALSQAAQSMALWSDTAFQSESPVVATSAGAALDPWFESLLGAAYADDMPPTSEDAAHARALAARVRA